MPIEKGQKLQTIVDKIIHRNMNTGTLQTKIKKIGVLNSGVPRVEYSWYAILGNIFGIRASIIYWMRRWFVLTNILTMMNRRPRFSPADNNFFERDVR